MPFRFRKSLKIAPGVKMNIGKKGASSISFGGRGHTVNIGKRGVKQTFSIPGTGISASASTAKSKRNKMACCPLAIFLLPVAAVRWMIGAWKN